MKESIEIKTLKDIVDKVPKESIDIFINDLKSWIYLTYKWMELEKQFPWMIEQDDTTMKWLDDWKNNATVNIKF